MKNIKYSFTLLVVLFSLLHIYKVLDTSKMNILNMNIEALAWGENGWGDEKPEDPETEYNCYVGEICYVMAMNVRYCGNCSYELVNPIGDGHCKTSNIFD